MTQTPLAKIPKKKGKYYGGGRKKLPLEEKIARQRELWNRKYKDRIVFQARTDKTGKEKLESIKKHLGFKSNDQLLEWLLERASRSIARKGEKLNGEGG